MTILSVLLAKFHNHFSLSPAAGERVGVRGPEFAITPLTPNPSPLRQGRGEIRSRLGWTLLAGLLVFGTMCVPFFLGRVYTADDLGEFHLPIRDFYSRQLAAGQSWDWMPSLFCGFYLTGEGQLGGYHPLHLLLYRTLPLGGAFNLELLLNYPFLAVGTYLFLRRIVVRRDAAAFGSLVFTFSSFNLLHFVHPNAVAVVAHIPWQLWAIDLVCKSYDRRTLRLAQCCIAILTGSQLLLGYPQYVWFSLLCQFGYVAFRLRGNPLWMRRTAGLFAATAVGGLIGAVQVLPTIDALANSSRSTVSQEFRTSGSLHPLNLVQPFAPYLFATRVAGQNTHELGMYFGCVPLVLCFWLWLNRARWGRWARIIWPVVAMTSLALLYAMGEYGPVYDLQASLPFVGNFRFPCRAIVLVELGIAVLSAIAFLQLTQQREPVSRALVLPAAVSMFLACYAPLGFGSYASTPLLIAAGPVLILLATWFVSRISHGCRWAAVMLVLLAAGDLAAYGLSYAVLRKDADLNEFVAAAGRPPLPATCRVAVNTGQTNSDWRYGNRLVLAGYSLADGYAGLEPAPSDGIPERQWLAFARTDWTRTDDGWIPLGNRQAKASFDLLHAEADIIRDSAGVISIKTRSGVDGTLFVSESFHPGWVARLDGRVVPIVRTKAGFMECQVPAGRHALDFRFEPSSLRLGFLLTTCGLGLTMSWAALAMYFSPSPPPRGRGPG